MKKIGKSVLDFEAPDMGLKCGVNTGRVLSGNFGIEGHDQLTVLGNNVNVANRLCNSIGQPGRIYVSTTTKNNIRDEFELSPLGKKYIKNIDEHEVFEVINTFERKEHSHQLVKGVGQIKADIPEEIRITGASKVSAEFFGSVDSAFLSLRLEECVKKYLWFGDPKSAILRYDAKTDKMWDVGLLNFRNCRYSNEWEFDIESKLKPGKGYATMGMFEVKDYEDKNGILKEYHPHVAIVTKEIQLVSAYTEKILSHADDLSVKHQDGTENNEQYKTVPTSNKIDPLKGRPYNEEMGIRYYSNRDDLPSLDSILKLDSLESVNILSITSAILIVTRKKIIVESLNRGVRFNFLILNPDDNVSVENQKRNYGERDIKGNVQDTLSALREIKNGLRNELNQNLSIRLYCGISIEEGVMIVKTSVKFNSWAKIESYSVGGDANSRSSRACYYHSNKEFFEQYEHYYNSIWNKDTTIEFDV